MLACPMSLGTGNRKTAEEAPAIGAIEDGMTVCGSQQFVDDAGMTYVNREMYSFPEINYTLAKYSELRRAAGMSAISTCTEARAFMQKYNAYLDDHPNFVEEGPDLSVIGALPKLRPSPFQLPDGGGQIPSSRPSD
jgi:hypothetical protein